MGAVVDEPPRRDDRLLVAVACSLVLHLGLLTLLPQLLDEGRKAVLELPKLTARLVAPKPPELPKLAEPAPPAPAPAPKAVLPAPQKSAPAPRAPENAPPIIAVPPTPSAAPAASVPAPAPVAPPVTVAPASPAPAAGPDPGSVAQFRLALIETARRYKRYPRAAVDNNWEGRVDLRMVVAANGSIASVSVRKSAGFRALDEEAQQMFRTALGQLAIPPALRGREFTLDVSADFSFLKE